MRHTYMSLSAIVAGLSAAVVASAMAVYAAVESFVHPGVSLEDLALTHGWHVLGLGTLTYLVVWGVVRQLVDAPMRSVDAHLYGVAVGNVAPLEMSSRVREIGRLVSGVNLMVSRMRLSGNDESLEVARDEARELRSVAFLLYSRAPEESAQLLEHLARLDEALTRTAGKRQAAA